MAIYTASIPVSGGHRLTFDGETYEVVKRCDPPRHMDEFVVEGPSGSQTKRHIDWFADKASKSQTIVIERAREADDGNDAAAVASAELEDLLASGYEPAYDETKIREFVASQGGEQ